MFLEIKNTNIGYHQPLISEVNTSLELGDVCLLIGNNGVGKTTLIKSILHQVPTLKGEIILKGKNIQNLSVKEIAEQIAIVFSKSPIPNNYTTTDLISLGKYIHYPYYFELDNEDKEEVQQIIKELNLSQYADLPLQKLSDGNLQKTFIGRALAQNSPFIILDEPTTHLDEFNKINILSFLRKIAKEKNKLILFSSHDWRLAKEFSDKIWFVKDQQLFSGTAEDLLLQHSELTRANIFHFNPNFIAPQITAPDLEKEMLYSFLQKNFDQNMTNISFEYKSGNWEMKKNSKIMFFKNFSEILHLIQNND